MDVLLQEQRLHHIVASYELAGEDAEPFMTHLQSLRQQHPSALIEWALVDVLVQNWLRYPLPRGQRFLNQVQAQLEDWQTTGTVSSALTPSQFEHVTGLRGLLPPLIADNVTSTQLSDQPDRL